MSRKDNPSLGLLGDFQQPASSRSAGTQGAEGHIRSVCIEMVEAHNTRDFHAVYQHMAPSVVARHDAGTESFTTIGRDELRSRWDAVMEANPNYHTDILDVHVNVNEVTGRARSWILRTATGFADGLKRETVSELSWERRDGEWWIVKYRGLRSFPWYNTETFYSDMTAESSPQGSEDSDDVLHKTLNTPGSQS